MLHGLVLALCALSGCAEPTDGPWPPADWSPPPLSELTDAEAPPDPFTSFVDGSPIEGEADWWARRRPELEALFAHYLYGRAAPLPRIEVTEQVGPEPAPPGLGQRLELELSFVAEDAETAGAALSARVLLFLPEGAGPFPVLLGLNKCGNHSLTPDTAVPLPAGFVEESCPGGAGEEGRGGRAALWSIETALSAGWAVASVHQSAFAPDDPDGAAPADAFLDPALGAEDRWGTLAMWAWGLAGVAQGLSQEALSQALIDPDRIAVFGHSRRGKAALLAGARSPLIDRVWSHQSGTGGAALTRGGAGETVGAITLLFPHWFGSRFADFADQENRLPVDQHLLQALIAPRPLLISDGDEDLWADPAGAEEAGRLAAPVFELLGGEAPQHTLRPGGHSVEPIDWEGFVTWVGDG